MSTAAMTAASHRFLPWLVAVGFFMQFLDATILNTALPTMARDLGQSPLRMQSAVIAYVLTVALLIPASGWLADRFGTRRIYQFAIITFTIGSLSCAVSQTLNQLVMSRVLQGCGGALLVPVGRLSLLRLFPRDQLIRVLSFVAIPGLIGPLIGPSLGGWIVEVASWRWIFLVNLPVGVAGILATSRFMPDVKGPQGPFDLSGYALIAVSMLMITLSLHGLGDAAWPMEVSLLLLFAGIACMAGYWLHAARAASPLFSPRLFSVPTYGVALLGNLFARLGSGAMPFMTPLLLQVGMGYSPSKAGMSMIPATLGAMASKAYAERLIRRYGYRRVLVGNTLMLGSVIAAFSLVGPAVPHAWVLAHLAIFGVFNSMQFTAMNTLALGGLDDTFASSGNSLFAVVVQLSMGIGVALAGVLLTMFSGHAPVAGSTEVLRTFHVTYLCIGGLSALAAVVFVQLGPNEGILKRSPPLPESMQ